MRLVFANTEFAIAGVELDGFPLLLADDGTLIEPVFSFLLQKLVNGGAVQSRKGWPTYGYGLLHYYRYLERHTESPRVS